MYSLNVYVPEVPPFNHSIPFTININVPIPTTTTPPVVSTSDGEIGDLDTTIIIVVVVLLIVIIIGLIIMGVMCWRRRSKQSISSTSEPQSK